MALSTIDEVYRIAPTERPADRRPPRAGDPPTVRPARPEDVALLLELFGELAEYEHLEHELQATEEQLGEALFGERPAAEALIAERGGEALGYALFFPTFSSFLASTGVWLEDLFVRQTTAARASAGRCSRRSRRSCASAAASAWNGRRSTGTSRRSASTGGSARRR